jgi:hypothetical protein
VARRFQPVNWSDSPTCPPRDEAISLLMATLRAPLDKLARTFNEIPSKLVRTIDAIRQQKEAEITASAVPVSDAA